MGIHSHQCPKCYSVKEVEGFGCVCQICGVGMSIMPGSFSKGTFKEFWHPNLSQEPVHITSTKCLDRELEKRNLHISEGRKGERVVRLPQTKEEALNV